VTTAEARETRVRRLLDALPTPGGTVTPRAFVAGADGSVLFDSGDTTLPITLSGVTKLYTLAMVLREIDRGALTLDTPVGELLPSDIMRGLCVYGGKDYSFSITVDQLLSHRSGIVDYMNPGSRKGRGFTQQLLEHDRGWSFEQALEISRHYPGLYPPGARSRANFSSTNYLILGAMLQETTGMKFEDLVQLRIVSPLDLQGTYVYGPQHYDKYFTITPVHRGPRVVRVPQGLASSGADGAIISTPRDTVAFFRAFWGGELCDGSWIPPLTESILPLRQSPRMGRGVMMARPGFRTPAVIGLSGISGVAAGVQPETKAFACVASHQWSTRKEAFALLTQVLRTMSPHTEEPKRLRV